MNKTTHTGFFVNQQEVNLATFTHIATDPSHSVAIEACAGSGKTTLLITRIIRILLDGCLPGEILAITFTKKAAQEMLQKLAERLACLARANDAEICVELENMGLTADDTMVERVRNLQAVCNTAYPPLQISTFHSWFARLLQLAPMSSGVAQERELIEDEAVFSQEQWNIWLNQLYPALLADLAHLYRRLPSDTITHDILWAVFDKRAEWLVMHKNHPQQAWLSFMELLGSDAHKEPVRHFFSTDNLHSLVRLAHILHGGSATQKTTAIEIEGLIADVQSGSETALTAGIEQCRVLFLRKDGKPRAAPKNKALDATLPAAWQEVVEKITELLARQEDFLAADIHRALLRLAHDWIRFYQLQKRQQRLMDFADLEIDVLHLLADEGYGSYFQERLSARYKHFLIDEFQDTNPLQWQIINTWLSGYQESGITGPRIFLVGDPKQSIYRFRRADPQIYHAALVWMKAYDQQLQVLRTDHTWRNAPEIINCLNQLFVANPLFRPHYTASTKSGGVLCLPLVERKTSDVLSDAGFSLRHPLQQAATANMVDKRYYHEAEQVIKALHSLQQQQAFDWKQVLWLVRKRSHVDDYESALRKAAIGFSSDRVESVGDSLEISDMLALCHFLLWQDNLSLAQLLRSPLFACSVAALTELATLARVLHNNNFYAALQARGDPSASVLARWVERASKVTVYQLMLEIYHEMAIPQCYAAFVPASHYPLVEKNLHAFISSLASGRVTGGLAQWLAYFRRYGINLPRDESVSEPRGIRIMTIHAAKGLEAEVVVLLGCNNREKGDSAGWLIDWPDGRKQPLHFSAYCKGMVGFARRELFEREAALAEQEEENLFYVAITRAKRFFIFSAAASGHSGLVEDSWYARAHALGLSDGIIDIHKL